MKLAEEQCSANIGGTPITERQADALLLQLPAWTLEGKTITREILLKDFRQAMDLVNRIAALAEEQDHHPDMTISYNKVRIGLTTHKIGGLSLNDFILAARIDLLLDRLHEKAA